MPSCTAHPTSCSCPRGWRPGDTLAAAVADEVVVDAAAVAAVAAVVAVVAVGSTGHAEAGGS